MRHQEQFCVITTGVLSDSESVVSTVDLPNTAPLGTGEKRWYWKNGAIVSHKTNQTRVSNNCFIENLITNHQEIRYSESYITKKKTYLGLENQRRYWDLGRRSAEGRYLGGRMYLITSEFVLLSLQLRHTNRIWYSFPRKYHSWS